MAAALTNSAVGWGDSAAVSGDFAAVLVKIGTKCRDTAAEFCDSEA